MSDVGFRVQDLGFRISGSGFGALCFGKNFRQLVGHQADIAKRRKQWQNAVNHNISGQHPRPGRITVLLLLYIVIIIIIVPTFS